MSHQLCPRCERRLFQLSDYNSSLICHKRHDVSLKHQRAPYHTNFVQDANVDFFNLVTISIDSSLIFASFHTSNRSDCSKIASESTKSVMSWIRPGVIILYILEPFATNTLLLSSGFSRKLFFKGEVKPTSKILQK